MNIFFALIIKLEKRDDLKTSKSDEIGLDNLISLFNSENYVSAFESVNDQVTVSVYPFDAIDL